LFALASVVVAASAKHSNRGRVEEAQSLRPSADSVAGRNVSSTDGDGVFVPYGCLVAAAVGSGVTVVSIPLVIASLGFGAEGVAAESLAAAWQSSLGEAGIESGSAFAKLQSVGMTSISIQDGVVVSGQLAVVMTAFCAKADDLIHAGGELCVKAGHFLGQAAQSAAGEAVKLADVLSNATKQAVSSAKASPAIKSAVGTIEKAAVDVKDAVAGAAGDVKQSVASLFPGAAGTFKVSWRLCSLIAAVPLTRLLT